MGYDDWLEEPYQRGGADNEECPKCGGVLVHDDIEKSVSCEDCNYSDGLDWDAVAEAREEAKWDNDPGRDEW